MLFSEGDFVPVLPVNLQSSFQEAKESFIHLGNLVGEKCLSFQGNKGRVCELQENVKIHAILHLFAVLDYYITEGFFVPLGFVDWKIFCPSLLYLSL